ncbi:unnamed protein product, partial [Prorocentrum cordatum]
GTNGTSGGFPSPRIPPRQAPPAVAADSPARRRKGAAPGAAGAGAAAASAAGAERKTKKAKGGKRGLPAGAIAMSEQDGRWAWQG